MDGSTRRQKLQEISKNSQNVVMTGIPLAYQGHSTTQNVYRIPLAYLVYNKYNGRIGTDVKSYEAQNHVLNPEDAGDAQSIERFLWKSKEDRNRKTMESLKRDHQQRYGIVTADGVIIDGNRRALLLNKLFRSRQELGYSEQEVDHCQYFLAIILPDNATRRDIEQLETIYQMGEDEKLEYNPIEKYLKCRDLLDQKFSTADIADFMNEKEQQIKEWLSILALMDSYLETYGYKGIYTRLEKTEGPFVDLNAYIDAYKKHSRTVKVNWDYDESDISDMQQVCFDYIRARYEGKEFREIAKTGTGGSIFAHKDIWKAFLTEHQSKTPQDVSTPDELRKQRPNEDLSVLFEERDSNWARAAHDSLRGNLAKHERQLEDQRDADKPLQLLERALDSLRAVDCSQPNFYDEPAVLDCVKEINSIIWDMKKSLDRGDRN